MNLTRLLSVPLCLAISACSTHPEDFEQARNQRVAKSAVSCVNLNTASVQDLTGLPAIGDVLANRIVEYRAKHGPFRRPQDIIIIEGFSENKYRAIAELICVDSPK
jgi:DNA uptake protein ComE-like DNA-binding protein